MRIICLDWPLERNAITVGKLNVIILGDFFFNFFFKSFCAANIKRKTSQSSVWAADWQLLSLLFFMSWPAGGCQSSHSCSVHVHTYTDIF